MTDPFPARLHLILARDTPKAIVFRRGPSKSVCTILWERNRDRFSVGQWLRGRIYERRADISPDGKYLIYFAMNGKWNSETGGSWTAISRTPWLKAIALFGKGDCWHGGGLFTGNKTYWLNDGYGHKKMQVSSEVTGDEDYQPDLYGGECPGVYYPRLLRDGWELTKCDRVEKWHEIVTFEKQLPKGWILKKLAHGQIGSPEGKGCYWDEHRLENINSKIELIYPHWEWADIDNKKLIYAERGCLYRCSVKNQRELSQPKLIYDFNPLKFEPIRAPY
ncbi:MAG: hypothetical protein AAGA60_14260 [Cyanobacteria bacterium P01_E01_bin.42]